MVSEPVVTMCLYGATVLHIFQLVFSRQNYAKSLEGSDGSVDPKWGQEFQEI